MTAGLGVNLNALGNDPTALSQARIRVATADAEQARADIMAAECRQGLAEAEQRHHQLTLDVAQYEADEIWARIAINGPTLDHADWEQLQQQLEERTSVAEQAADDAAYAAQQAVVAGLAAASARGRLAAAEEHRAAGAAAVVAALTEASGNRRPSMLRQ